MVILQYTNIVIDDFSVVKNNPFNKYVHFLSHIHTDHLKGLNNSWDYGKIYCTQITKKLLLQRYPNLKCIVSLSLNQQHTIQLTSQLQVTVTLFDANHCAGAAMLLFEGYLGRVLYTGDFRFDKQKFSKYKQLYPPSKINNQFEACSKSIDVLHIDNTFLQPKFDFPKQQEAYLMIQKYVDYCFSKKHKLYIGMENYGKEQVLVKLAKKFDTLIVVDDTKYQIIVEMKLDHQLFTTKINQGWIQVVQRRQLTRLVKSQQNARGLIMTGWANKPSPSFDSNPYRAPYSLHSNYQEIISFVKSIRPSQIRCFVESKSLNFQDKNGNYDMYKPPNYNDGIKYLRQNFCKPYSPDYQYLKTNVLFQKQIQKKLGINRSIAQINKQQLGLETISNNLSRARKPGYKFSSQRNQSLINKVKQNVRKKKLSSNSQSACISKYNMKRTQITPSMDVEQQFQEQQYIQEINNQLSDGEVQQIQNPLPNSISNKRVRQRDEQSHQQQDPVDNIMKKYYEPNSKAMISHKRKRSSKNYFSQNDAIVLDSDQDKDAKESNIVQSKLMYKKYPANQTTLDTFVNKSQHKEDSQQNQISTTKSKSQEISSNLTSAQKTSQKNKVKQIKKNNQPKYKTRINNLDQDQTIFKKASKIKFLSPFSQQFQQYFDQIKENIISVKRQLQYFPN